MERRHRPSWVGRLPHRRHRGLRHVRAHAQLDQRNGVRHAAHGRRLLVRASRDGPVGRLLHRAGGNRGICDDRGHHRLLLVRLRRRDPLRPHRLLTHWRRVPVGVVARHLRHLRDPQLGRRRNIIPLRAGRVDRRARHRRVLRCERRVQRLRRLRLAVRHRTHRRQQRVPSLWRRRHLLRDAVRHVALPGHRTAAARRRRGARSRTQHPQVVATVHLHPRHQRARRRLPQPLGHGRRRALRLR